MSSSPHMQGAQILPCARAVIYRENPPLYTAKATVHPRHLGALPMLGGFGFSMVRSIRKVLLDNPKKKSYLARSEETIKDHLSYRGRGMISQM